MKNECKIVCDLLPLYAEDMVAEETGEFVADHLEGCMDCRSALEKIKSSRPVPKPEAGPFKEIKKTIRKRRRLTALLAALLALVFCVSLFSYLTAPRYLSLEESGLVIDSSQLSAAYNGVKYQTRVQFDFSDRATACELEEYSGEDGTRLCILSAWYTLWDKWSGAAGNVSCVFDYEFLDPVVVRYSQNNGSEDVTVYQANTESTGGSMTLPRLVMGYYLLFALAAAAVLAVLWLVLRKKKSGALIGKLFFVPLSYVCGTLLVMGYNTASYNAARDFVLTLTVTALIYASVLTAGKLRQFRVRS